MNAPHAPGRRRRPTNLSLDAGLLDEARELGVNLSRACERGLAEQVAEARAERWRAENAPALADSNAFVEREGLPLTHLRLF
jgi:antitoxin CcdA